MQLPQYILAATLAVVLAPGCEGPASPPNVLLVTIDTLRADHCSAYGYGIPTTPNLTRLAKGGVLFRNAYAPSSTTAPSHAELLTGRFFRTLGVLKNGHVLSDDALTLTEAMKAEGYATAGFVSSFPVKARFGFAQGFEVYDDEFAINDASIGRRARGVAHDRLAAATNNRVEAWLRARKDERPLFMWVHYVDPHFPYRAPEKFIADWPKDIRSAVRQYDSEIRYVDKQLGRLVDAFERVGGADQALIVVTSDHGEGLGDHGFKFHGTNLYEESVRIPLIARWNSRLPEGIEVEEPVALVDVAPSILDVVGASTLPVQHGQNLFGSRDADRRIYLQRREYDNTKVGDIFIYGDMTAIVHRNRKFIAAYDDETIEFYNLLEDPREERNLLQPASSGTSAKQSSATEPAADYERHLADWHSTHPQADTGRRKIDREAARALRALGYVE